jgi:hypothetical protein
VALVKFALLDAITPRDKIENLVRNPDIFKTIEELSKEKEGGITKEQYNMLGQNPM